MPRFFLFLMVALSLFFYVLYVKLRITMCVWTVFVFNQTLCNKVLSGHILTRSVCVGFEVLAGNHIISCQRQQWKWTRAPWWRNDFMNGSQRSHRMAEPPYFRSKCFFCNCVWKRSRTVNMIPPNTPQLLNCTLAVCSGKATGFKSSKKILTSGHLKQVNVGY